MSKYLYIPMPISLVCAESKATVYFLRYEHEDIQSGVWGMGLVKASIYCDNVLLAKLPRGKYFAIRLEPGKHIMRVSDRDSATQFELKAGEEYFIRVELQPPGIGRLRGVVMQMDPEKARSVLSSLKPIEAKHVRDRARVIPGLPGQDN